MEVSWTTLLIQLGLFVYCLLILKFLVFGPLMKILQRRDEMTVGKATAAGDLEGGLSALRIKYDDQIAALRDALEESRHETLRKNRELTEGKIKSAKARVERQIVEKRALLEQEAERVRAKVPQMSEALAQEILQAITGSKVVRQ